MPCKLFRARFVVSRTKLLIVYILVYHWAVQVLYIHIHVTTIQHCSCRFMNKCREEIIGHERS